MKNIIKKIFASKKGATKERKTLFVTIGSNWGSEITEKSDGLKMLPISTK